MPVSIALVMADCQIFCMAVATIAQGLNVLQRCRLGRHMFAANPARHYAMKLARNDFVNLVTRKTQFTHDRDDLKME